MRGYFQNNRVYSVNDGFVPKQNQSRPKAKSRGLGDTVEKVLRITGIKKLWHKFVPEKSCGCKGRQQTLNKLVPYR